MRNSIFIILATFLLSLAVFAQTKTTPTQSSRTATTETKRVVFRATKDQITQAQKLLKSAETGKMDDDFRESVKKYQAENGLKATGTLNRATLEKLGIALTDKQKEIPVNPDSFASADDNKTTKKRGPVFRATKDQITQAQKLMKQKGMYAGEPNGTLDPDTRTALKAFQEANGLKATGTLNQTTLEKMGITLTDKQKENASKNSP